MMPLSGESWDTILWKKKKKQQFKASQELQFYFNCAAEGQHEQIFHKIAPYAFFLVS